VIAALVLAALAQITSVAPDTIYVPAGQAPLGVWPGYESDPTRGATTLTVTYVVPSQGVVVGGSILLGIGYFAGDNGNPAYAATCGWIFGPTPSCSKFPFGQFQRATPSALNWCTATSSVGGIACTLFRHPNLSQDVLLRVRATVAQAAGTVWTITLGDTSQGSPGLSLSWQPGRVSVVALEDLADTGTWVSPASSPVVLVTGQTPEGFLVNGPCTPRVGDVTRITVRPVTGHDNPYRDPIDPCEDFAGTVFLQCSDAAATFATPRKVTFTHADRGCREVFVIFATPGIQTITAIWDRDMETLGSQIASLSNSMLVQDATSNLAIDCGDIQRHSSPGGHAAVPDRDCWQDLYDDAQDFGCVVQHSYNYMADWAAANNDAAQFGAGKVFVAFPGYEWSLGGAHRHVVYRNVTTDPAITDRTYEGFGVPAPTLRSDVTGFLGSIANDPTDRPHLAIAHHSLWDGSKGGFSGVPYPWGPLPDDPAQPIVEIYSDHGSSEVWLAQAGSPDDYPMSGDLSLGEQRASTDRASVRDALKIGYRFGFVAGSDRHNYRSYVPGAEGFTRTGLAFVVSRLDVTVRQGVWRGLTTRNCYATTGARIVLNWRAGDGTRMGGETGAATPTFAIEAHASGILRDDRPWFTRLQIIRDDQVVETRTLAESDVTTTYADAAPLSGTHAYYARLTQDDWHVAWTTPIWVTVP
jgi:hypothetical protein